MSLRRAPSRPHHLVTSRPDSLELVVARYEESLNWLRRVPPSWRITVYDKGASGGDRSILPDFRKGEGGERVRLRALPNIGREAHTYAHHIASRLAEPTEPLADVTVFCQGRPFDHAWDFHHTLRGLASDSASSLSLGDWRWLGHIIDTDTPDGALFRAWSKNTSGQGLDIGGFHQALLGVEGPERYVFVLGGQFAVRRQVLEARGLAFWRRALEISVSWPEAAHCFERTWDKVLGVSGPTAEQMAGRATVHLKRIKA